MSIHREEEKFIVDDVRFPNIDQNSYLKFISYFDGLIWIAAREFLIGFDLENHKFIEKKRILMTENFRDGINFITKIGETYFMTAWGSGQIFCFKDFSELGEKNCNVNEKFGFKGTPYFITNFDGKFYITEIDSHQGIYEFSTDSQGEVREVKEIFSFGEPKKNDIRRKMINPVLRG